MGVAERGLHPVESAAVGAFARVIEVLLQQPSVSIKNSIQSKKPVSLDPRVLYRGVGINAMSTTPVIAVQFGVHSFLQKSLTNSPTAVQRGAIAGVAGMVSAFLSCPAELLMIQQQRSGLSLIEQAHSISKHGGLSIFRGMAPTVIRDGIFTATYLGMLPLVRHELMTWPGAHLKDRPNLTTLLAASVSGLVSAVVTHPFDTIKTRMQANIDLPSYRTMASTTKILWEQGKMGSLYSGILPRTQRVVCAVYIYSEVRTHLTGWYLKTFAAD